MLLQCRLDISHLIANQINAVWAWSPYRSYASLCPLDPKKKFFVAGNFTPLAPFWARYGTPKQGRYKIIDPYLKGLRL
jgi:hypothetical protein